MRGGKVEEGIHCLKLLGSDHRDDRLHKKGEENQHPQRKLITATSSSSAAGL